MRLKLDTELELVESHQKLKGSISVEFQNDSEGTADRFGIYGHGVLRDMVEASSRKIRVSESFEATEKASGPH